MRLQYELAFLERAPAAGEPFPVLKEVDGPFELIRPDLPAAPEAGAQEPLMHTSVHAAFTAHAAPVEPRQVVPVQVYVGAQSAGSSQAPAPIDGGAQLPSMQTSSHSEFCRHGAPGSPGPDPSSQVP